MGIPLIELWADARKNGAVSTWGEESWSIDLATAR